MCIIERVAMIGCSCGQVTELFEIFLKKSAKNGDKHLCMLYNELEILKRKGGDNGLRFLPNYEKEKNHKEESGKEKNNQEENNQEESGKEEKEISGSFFWKGRYAHH